MQTTQGIQELKTRLADIWEQGQPQRDSVKIYKLLSDRFGKKFRLYPIWSFQSYIDDDLSNVLLLQNDLSHTEHMTFQQAKDASEKLQINSDSLHSAFKQGTCLWDEFAGKFLNEQDMFDLIDDLK